MGHGWQLPYGVRHEGGLRVLSIAFDCSYSRQKLLRCGLSPPVRPGQPLCVSSMAYGATALCGCCLCPLPETGSAFGL